MGMKKISVKGRNFLMISIIILLASFCYLFFSLIDNNFATGYVDNFATGYVEYGVKGPIVREGTTHCSPLCSTDICQGNVLRKCNEKCPANTFEEGQNKLNVGVPCPSVCVDGGGGDGKPECMGYMDPPKGGCVGNFYCGTDWKGNSGIVAPEGCEPTSGEKKGGEASTGVNSKQRGWEFSPCNPGDRCEVNSNGNVQCG